MKRIIDDKNKEQKKIKYSGGFFGSGDRWVWNNFFSKDIDVKKAISTAFWGAIASTLLTLVFAIYSGGQLTTVLDSVFCGLMAWGIYKKNRVCAISLFIYFLISKIYQIGSGGLSALGFIVGLIFLSIFFLGIRGTLKYHKENGKIKLNTREIISTIFCGIIIILMIIGLFIS